MAELWRNVGTDFDPRVVQAMAAVWDTKLVQHAGDAGAVAAPFRDPISTTLPFRLRATRAPQPVG